MDKKILERLRQPYVEELTPMSNLPGHPLFKKLLPTEFVQQATELDWSTEKCFALSKVGIRIKEQLCADKIPKCLHAEVDFLLNHNRATTARKLPLQIQLDGWKAFFSDLERERPALLKSAEEALSRWFETIVDSEEYNNLDKSEFAQLSLISKKLETIKEHLRTLDCTIDELKEDLKDTSFKKMLQEYKWAEAEETMRQLEAYVNRLKSFKIDYLPEIPNVPVIEAEVDTYQTQHVNVLKKMDKIISVPDLQTFSGLKDSIIFQHFVWNPVFRKFKSVKWEKEDLEALVRNCSEEWDALLNSIASQDITFGKIEEIFRQVPEKDIRTEIRRFKNQFSGGGHTINEDVFTSFIELQKCKKYMAPLLALLKV